MHIVFLCNEYPPSNGGGIGTFTRTLAKKLAEVGCTVSVVGLYSQMKRTIDNDCGVRVIRLPINRTPVLNLLRNQLTLKKQLMILHREHPIDILEGQENAFWCLSTGTPGRKVIRMHGGHHFFAITLGRNPAFRRSVIERLSFQHADHFCAVSHFVAETTRELLQLGNRPIRILPNPVDIRLFCPQPETPIEPGLILFAGTICEKKGIRQLVEAMQEIIRVVPYAHLVALGRDGRDDQTGENFRILLESVIPASIREKITFPGMVPNADLPKWLARAEICVFPSHMESQGIVVIEAMACGKPVIASLTGPGSELITDDEDGLLCDPHDPASIASQTIRLLQNVELRQKLGFSARMTALKKFSIDHLVSENVSFYRECLD